MDNHAEPLPVARRENFARLVVAGRNQSDAYREAYPNARAWRDSTVRVKASQLANRPEIAGRILALKREAASAAVATAVPLSGPVGVTFGYYFPATQEGAADMRRHGVAMRRKTSKPDVDNIGKNLLDCMTRAGFFTDDSAVALIHAEKFEVTGRPRISVRVRQLPESPGGLFARVEVGPNAGEVVEPG